MPWPEFGDTDFLLIEGYRQHQRLICGCGCGQWRDDCQDASTSGRWQVEATVCYAREAIAAFQEQHKDGMPDGLQLGVRLLPLGEIPTDPLTSGRAVDVEAEFAAMKARHNLT